MTPERTQPPYLRRFTNLAVAMDMLVNERITLLNPKTWEDQNDVAFINAFRDHKKLPNVFAVCFAQAPETFHHWRVFAHGMDGVKVNIDKIALLESLKNKRGYVWNDVEYMRLDEIAKLEQIALYDLPFIKRAPYADEQEFRILYECSNHEAAVHDLKIKREWIKSITLSPWVPGNLVDSLKEIIPSLPGCEDVSVLKTTIKNNVKWQRGAKRIVDDLTILAGRPRNPIA